MARPIKENNRKAPRFRRSKGAYCVISRELFKRYKDKYPTSRITYEEFSGFLLEHIDLLTEEVSTSREGIRLPYSIGSFFVGACRPKESPLDFKKSLEYGIEVKANNFETDGLIASIFFTNYHGRYKIPNRKVWRFLPARIFKNKVSKRFKENFQYYKQVDKTDKIWKKVID
jgi:hypothetical protein